jgi:hypothetical protein
MISYFVYDQNNMVFELDDIKTLLAKIRIENYFNKLKEWVTLEDELEQVQKQFHLHIMDILDWRMAQVVEYLPCFTYNG